MLKTGFSFIDEGLGGLHAGDLATVQRECIQTEQLKDCPKFWFYEA